MSKSGTSTDESMTVITNCFPDCVSFGNLTAHATGTLTPFFTRSSLSDALSSVLNNGSPFRNVNLPCKLKWRSSSQT